MKIQVLKRSNFPSNAFFEHLQSGTRHYQEHNFGRAIEEWIAASRSKFSEPINFKPAGGRLFFGSMIQEIPFLFFLYAIYVNKSTGVALVKTEEASKKVIFQNGLIVFAATTRKEERIGRFILRQGKLKPNELEDLAKQSRLSGKRLGTYLVEKGVITSNTLEDLLALQIEEILSDTFFWKSGHFYFLEKDVPSENVVKYTPLKAALMAAKRGFNFSKFKREVPDNRIIFRPSPYVKDGRKAVKEQLNANEKFILSLIDGTRNIEQLILFSGAEEVSVMNILYRLSSLGLVRKTKEVGEYEDKEFQRLSRILKTLFQIYQIITSELFRQIGARGKEIVEKARKDLHPDYKVVFVNVALEEPGSLDANTILRNIASYFPSPDQRHVFLEAFYGLFINILDASKKILGSVLTKDAIEKIRIIRSDMETFSDKTLEHTVLRSRSMEILDEIIENYR